MKKTFILPPLFLGLVLFFAVGFFGVNANSARAAGTIELIGIGHSNSVCTGPLAPDGGTYFERTDAPINNPNVAGDEAVAAAHDARPRPSAYPNACFQLTVFETQPNGNQNPPTSPNETRAYVPSSAQKGEWHVGSGVSSISPSPGNTAGGLVKHHAFGSAAATFESRSCTAYSPPQCTNTGNFVYTDWQSGRGCSGGALLQQESGTENYNTAPFETGNPLTEREAAALAKSLNASCSSLTITENWKRGEPVSRDVTFAAYGAGSKPVARSNSGRSAIPKGRETAVITGTVTNFALYQVPERICTPASGGCTAVPTSAVTPSATITANPPIITKGQSSTLIWSSANALTCTGTRFSTLGKLLGTTKVSPGVTTTYPLVCLGGSSSGGIFSGSGTWQYKSSDISDIFIAGGGTKADPNNAYSAVPNCSSSNPEGNSCSGSGICKVNTVNGSLVSTTIYECKASGGSSGSSSLSPAYSTATVTVVDGDTPPGPPPVTPPGGGPGGPGGGGPGGGPGSGEPLLETPQCRDGFDNNDVYGADYPNDPACESSEDTEEGALPSADVSLSVNRWLILSGSSVVLAWSAVNVEPGSCTLSGTNRQSWPLSGESEEGTQQSASLTSETRFTLSCNDYNGEEVSDSVLVRLIPRYKEF